MDKNYLDKLEARWTENNKDQKNEGIDNADIKLVRTIFFRTKGY